MHWISDILIGLLPSRVQWAITAILGIFVIPLLTYFYVQGRLVW
jgi:hypothetical protein